MTPTPQQIIEAVCERMGVSVTDLCEGSRKGAVSDARAIASWLLRAIRNDSYPFIASVVGGGGHNTAVNGCQRVDRTPKLHEVATSLLRSMTHNPVFDDLPPTPPYCLKTREILATLNADAQVRGEVMNHLRAALIGQIVAEHTPTPP